MISVPDNDYRIAIFVSLSYQIVDPFNKRTGGIDQSDPSFLCVFIELFSLTVRSDYYRIAFFRFVKRMYYPSSP